MDKHGTIKGKSSRAGWPTSPNPDTYEWDHTGISEGEP